MTSTPDHDGKEKADTESDNHLFDEIQFALCLGRRDVVRSLLEHNPELVHRHDPLMSGNTLLHLAAEINEIPMILLLSEKGANVNAQNVQGETPLHMAAQNRHIPTASILLGLGASLAIKNEDGQTPEEAASASDNGPMATMLRNIRFARERNTVHKRLDALDSLFGHIRNPSKPR